MTDEEKLVAEEQSTEVATPSETEDMQETQEQAQERPSKNYQDRNWAEARRRQDELERQNRDLQDRLKAMEKPDDEDVHLNEDDLPTYGNLKKVMKKDRKGLVEEIRKEIRAEMAQSNLKLHYPDFDDVVTPENIELLKQQKPALAKSLSYNPDPYDQAVAAYDAIKMAGLKKESKEMPKSNDKEKALKNAAKPVSVNAVSKQSAIGNAHLFENGLTAEVKKSLWAEMQQAMKGA